MGTQGDLVHSPTVSPAQQPLFERQYGRTSFGFEHRLANEPLLSVASLQELAHRLAPANVYRSCGQIRVGDRWETGADRAATLDETFATLATGNALIMLRGGVHDPVLGPLLRGVLQELVDLVGRRLGQDLTSARATILLASPRRITAYHIDADVNFLMQVAGSKRFYVHDAHDQSIITDEELELYFAGDANAARFVEARSGEAVCHRLAPGLGAHVPACAPHWAVNGDEVSIAVSFNFDLRSVDRLAGVYKINRRLRQIGIHPVGPRAAGHTSRLKLAAYRTYAAGLGPRPPSGTDAGWVPDRC